VNIDETAFASEAIAGATIELVGEWLIRGE
jgi:hypothetical protein